MTPAMINSKPVSIEGIATPIHYDLSGLMISRDEGP